MILMNSLKRQSRPTSCVVCGSDAAGYNYDVRYIHFLILGHFHHFVHEVSIRFRRNLNQNTSVTLLGLYFLTNQPTLSIRHPHAPLAKHSSDGLSSRSRSFPPVIGMHCAILTVSQNMERRAYIVKHSECSEKKRLCDKFLCELVLEQHTYSFFQFVVVVLVDTKDASREAWIPWS